MRNTFNKIALLMVILALAISACGTKSTPTAEATQPSGATEPAVTQPPAATEPPASGGLQIPEIEQGKFNVAAVLIGPHDDGGWSQAHYEGLM